MPDKKDPEWVSQYLENPPTEGAQELTPQMQRKMNGTKPKSKKNAKAS